MNAVPVSVADQLKEDIRVAAENLEMAKANLEDAIVKARVAQISWAKIGDIFNITKQAAWERFNYVEKRN